MFVHSIAKVITPIPTHMCFCSLCFNTKHFNNAEMMMTVPLIICLLIHSKLIIDDA